MNKYFLLLLALLSSFLSVSQRRGVVSSSIKTQIVYTPADQDLIMKLNPAALMTMMQEGTLLNRDITAVTTNGDVVGSIMDLGRAAFKFRSTLNSTKPTLSSDGTVNSFLVSNGTPLSYPVSSTTNGGQAIFKFFHGVSPTFSIRWNMKMGTSTNGVDKVLFASGGTTSTNFGINFHRTTANKLALLAVKGVSGQSVYNYTSTFTIDEALGWVKVQVTVTGATGTVYFTDSGGTTTTETFSVGTGVTTAASANFTMFTTAGVSYSHVEIWNRVLTTQEINDYKTYNPARNSTPVAVPKWWIDFSDGTKLFSDAGGTTPVVNNDFIRVINSQISCAFAGVTRTASSANNTEAPFYRTNYQNGLSVAEYTATQNITFSEGLVDVGQAGRYTIIAVAKNVNATTGSHIWNGNIYGVITAAGYNSGAIFSPYVTSFGHPYFVPHAQSASSAAAILTEDATDLYQIIVMVGDGNNITSYNKYLSKATGTWTDNFQINGIGFTGGTVTADWNMSGPYLEFKFFTGVADEIFINAEIARMRYKWNF